MGPGERQSGAALSAFSSVSGDSPTPIVRRVRHGHTGRMVQTRARSTAASMSPLRADPGHPREAIQL